MNEQASWLIQPIKGDRSKRLFGLPAPLVKGEKIAQFRFYLSAFAESHGFTRGAPLGKEKNLFLLVL